MPDGAGWAGTRRGSGIVGIGCTTRDDIVTAAPSEIATFLLTQRWERSVTIGISEAQRLASLRFGASHGCHDWTAGGTLPNTLCAAASARDAHGLPLGSISWRGNAEYGDSVLSDIGVAHMREWGIDVQPTYPPGFVREAYCFVDAVTRDVRQISIYEQAAQIAPLQDWTVHDVVIMTVGDLVRADDELLDCVRSCHRLALLVADWRPLPGSNALGECLERLGNLAFMVGQERDFVELGLCDPQTRTFDPLLDQVECIGTNGPEPVVWKKSGAVNGARLPLDPVHETPQNALGAGDGYAGAFLACRIAGLNSVTAHAHASSHAMHVMRSGMSYVSRSRDLNCVFPPQIERRSASTAEGALAERIHMSPGLVVTSCGQTGIDQLALQTARRLGLTGFAIMPEGRRTECKELGIGGPDLLEGATAFELATPSYRFCTWTNVFASDGTMLFDYAGSEGCEETRRAAAWFGRPVLELQEIAIADVPVRVTDWIGRFGIRVVNCAGTRMSLLGAGHHGAGAVLRRALLTAAAAVARRDCGIGTPPPTPVDEERQGWPAVVVAAPNSPVSRELLRGFLRDAAVPNIDALESFTSGQLSWLVPSHGLRVVFARARDLPMALRSRWADYAIFGADVRLEDGHEIEPLFPIGVDACCLVEVVDPARESERRMRHARCASAWPNLARSLLSQKGSTPAAEIVPVAGCTEAWLSSGAVDLGVDTYQTGKAVDDNGLRVTRRFRTVHSWMHRSTHSPPQLHPLISAFARWLHGSPEAVAAAARR